MANKEGQVVQEEPLFLEGDKPAPEVLGRIVDLEKRVGKLEAAVAAGVLVQGRHPRFGK